MGVLRMAAFHLRSFLRTTFFVQLMATSTVSMVCVQALAAYAYGTGGGDIWVRAGMFGCWTTTTVAAGIIGFQRFQGTLPHLLLTPRPAAQTVGPVVASASLFGLFAFPLAAGVSTLLGHAPAPASVAWTLGGAALYWLACFSLSCAVAAIFVLSPNAMTYEGLLVVPLILVSGVFVAPGGVPSWAQALSTALPTASAARLLLERHPSMFPLTVLCIGASVAWLVVARLALAQAIWRATDRGTLEVI